MRAYAVIVVTPQLKLFPCIRQGEEDFGVQALIAQPAVEGFYIAILDLGVPAG
jgi:hypothetical protein